MPAKIGPTLITGLPDSELVKQARLGNARAIEEIDARYRHVLRTFCRNLVGVESAEDVTQQALAKAYWAIADTNGDLDLKPWLFRIAHNEAIDMARRALPPHEQIPTDFDGVIQPPQKVAQAERVRELVDEISKLPSRQRSALVMQEFEGYSNREVAKKLKTSPVAVKKLVSRARTSLREKLAALLPFPWLVRHFQGSGVSMNTSGELVTGIKYAAVVALAAGSISVVSGQFDFVGKKTAGTGASALSGAFAMMSGQLINPASPLTGGSGSSQSKAGTSSKNSQDGGLEHLSSDANRSNDVFGNGPGGSDNGLPGGTAVASGDLFDLTADFGAGPPKGEGDVSHPNNGHGDSGNDRGKGKGKNRDKDEGKGKGNDKDDPKGDDDSPGNGGSNPGGGSNPPAQVVVPPAQKSEPKKDIDNKPKQDKKPPSKGVTKPGDGSDPPNDGGNPPGQGDDPPGEGDKPPDDGGGEPPDDGGGNPPGDGDESPPDNSDPPGKGNDPPGGGEDPPGNSDPGKGNPGKGK